MVNVRVSPGWRLGSPVSPTLSASSILSAPLVTGTGGSPESAIGILSNGVSVFNTTISCSIVPLFLTTNVTSPAGALLIAGTRVIGPLRPLLSPSATDTAPAAAGAMDADGVVDATDVVGVAVVAELVT